MTLKRHACSHRNMLCLWNYGLPEAMILKLQGGVAPAATIIYRQTTPRSWLDLPCRPLPVPKIPIHHQIRRHEHEHNPTEFSGRFTVPKQVATSGQDQSGSGRLDGCYNWLWGPLSTAMQFMGDGALVAGSRRRARVRPDGLASMVLG